MIKDGPAIFMAEVRNIKDPWKARRHQLRIYGHHDDQQNIKDEDLPWATPMHPITSAATNKVGIVPTGLVVGSRVIGLFLDEAKQYPIIIGSYSRSAQPTNPQDNSGGEEGLDSKNPGIDIPTGGNLTGEKLNNGQ